ncbi:MAG: peptidyl-prolyl cis-trans isomerase A [Deltaproteobacteria bacterium HGW-Deltaproteobacteria-18]|nr:MAG: peptidyl-prolyl cis-trans isomerase A [Deltaproteobacteria bacterium HGW-Deltaproteobacteria-18]
MSNPVVLVDTTKGEFLVELFADKAPLSVANFLGYVDDDFYVGTLIHRVVKGFMVQGGGLDNMMREKPTRPPVVNEAANGLKNLEGTVAMARTADPHSACAQFFVNTVDNPDLDHQGEDEFGYCVFGQVIDGMDVVKKIEKVRVKAQGDHEHAPADQVSINSITRFE